VMHATCELIELFRFGTYQAEQWYLQLEELISYLIRALRSR
jgi:hypothetical protein